LNHQQARHADHAKGATPKESKANRALPEDRAGGDGTYANADGEHSTIHHHGDGTHSVEHSDGEKSGPHGHLHEAMAHVAKKHGGGGKHHFAHSDGMGPTTTHHVGEDGEVGAEEHGSPDEAMESGKSFMSDGGGEGMGEPDGDEGAAMPMPHHGGLSGFGG